MPVTEHEKAIAEAETTMGWVADKLQTVLNEAQLLQQNLNRILLPISAHSLYLAADHAINKLAEARQALSEARQFLITCLPEEPEETKPTGG